MGLRALTFLEWFKVYHDKADTRMYFNYFDAARVRANFYSTPFKPELITELFEGWEKYSEDNYGNRGRIFLGNGIDGITYDRGGYLLGKNGLAINEWEMGVYINFATLNDFISDCQRAGIELTFKQEVINKYFK